MGHQKCLVVFIGKLAIKKVKFVLSLLAENTNQVSLGCCNLFPFQHINNHYQNETFPQP